MSEGPILLALDQSSTRTGWVRGAPEGPVSLGSFGLSRCGGNYGRALQEFDGKLCELLDGVTHLAFEQPVRPGNYLNLHTARLLYGIAGMIELVANRHGLPVMEADTNQLKKLFYGKGGKKPPEREAIAHARSWGIDATNGDEADAAGVFLFTVHHRFPDAFKAWADQKKGALL